MDNIKDLANCAEMNEQEQIDVAKIFRSIFCACDVDNTNMVPVSKLIEFIQPYMIEDLNALEDLRHALDPDDVNTFVHSEHFYQVMGKWSQKIAAISSNTDTEFNRSPSRLTVIDNKDLPYTHSTPRASLGDKLLRCKDLLNISNVSGYSLSTSRLDSTNPTDSDKTVLEEEIKKLEYQLIKTSDELTITKQQLVSSEEQIEMFQKDLDRLNRRLQAEQKINEHLQKEKKISEDCRDELQQCKIQIEEMKKKLSQSEKDSIYHRDFIHELEDEKMKLEKNISSLSEQHQECLKEIFYLKSSLEKKEEFVADLKEKFESEILKQKETINHLKEENEILQHQKSTLEEALKAKSHSSLHSNLGNLNLLSSSALSLTHTDPINTCPNLTYRTSSNSKSRPLLQKLLVHSSTPVNTMKFVMDTSIPSDMKSLPLLSPIRGTRKEESFQCHDSSEEDISWKLQQGDAKKERSDFCGTTLQDEIHRANTSTTFEKSYPTFLFEEDERRIELEDEIVRIKDYLEKVEDERNDMLTKMKERDSLKEELNSRTGSVSSMEKEPDKQKGQLKHTKKKVSSNEELQLKGILNTEEQKDDESARNKGKENLKYSVETEEKSLHPTQKCEKCEELEKNLETVLSKLTVKSVCLVEAENKLKCKNDVENNLKAVNAELESRVANLKEEVEHLSVKLQKIDRIDGVASEIQKLIDEKNTLILELKQLNVKMESCLYEAQIDLKQKIEDIFKLRNEWTKSIDIKNDLWNKVKFLEKENSEIRLKNNELERQNEEFILCNEHLETKYNKLLMDYDLEINENVRLSEQITENLIVNKRDASEFNDLKNEYDNIVFKLEAEVQRKQEIAQDIMDYHGKCQELKYTNTQESVHTVTKNDNCCQTDTIDIQGSGEDFSKMNIEYAKLLEELEIRLNKEVDKNEQLTNSLFEMKKLLSLGDAELLEMKEKINNNEKEMLSNLQKYIDRNESLVKELSCTRKAVQDKNLEIEETMQQLNKTEQERNMLEEKYLKQKQELTENREELNKIKDFIQTKEAQSLNLQEKLNEMLNTLEQNRTEMEKMESNNKKLHLELDLTKKQKDEINNQLFRTISQLKKLEEKMLGLQQECEKKEKQERIKISNIQNINKQLQYELNLMRDNEEKLNNDLLLTAGELNQMKERYEENENNKNMLLNETNQKLQEEIEKNKTLLTNYSTLKLERDQLANDLSKNENNKNILINETNQKLQEEIKKNKTLLANYSTLMLERDQLTNDLSNVKSSLTDTIASYNKSQTEIKELQVKNSELELTVEHKLSQLNKLECELEETQNKLKLIISEKKLINTELSRVISSFNKIKSQLSDTETLLADVKRQLGVKSLDYQRLSMELEEAKRKLLENSNSDTSSSSSNADKETRKRKTYSRQQITIEKLKDKLEDLETKLKFTTNENQHLKLKLSMTEKKIFEDETCKSSERLNIRTKRAEEKTECIKEIARKENAVYTEAQTGKELRSFEMEGDHAQKNSSCESKTVNKFTIACRPVCPDSLTEFEGNGLDDPKEKLPTHGVKCDSFIDIPPLDINGCVDDIIENLETHESSSRSETEEKVTAFTLRMLISCGNIAERIETETDKYRSKYEDILCLLRDISNRLRDHVCIGTAEPIMPVYVLLEDIKLQLKDLVQTAGQVGVLIYEDRMRKCWNLVTNYMANLRQENEALRCIARETTPTQTGPIRRRTKATQDRAELIVENTPQKRKRTITCSRLCSVLIFLLAFALTISLMIHLNCRMTTSENQYCPLDGIITRINIGVPPM